MTGERPVVGLSGYRESATWGQWDATADLLNTQYAAAVARSGGVPVIVPPTDRAGAVRVVERFDALVLSGGADLDPASYGAEPDPSTGEPRRDRDASEAALLQAAIARGIPVLGVCRGIQVMAAYAGGSLVQHVPDVVGHDEHSPGPGAYGTIEVAVRPEATMHRILGEHASVPCHHHQAVRTAPGYDVTAYAKDGTIEAMERPDLPFCVGIQWHPEANPGDDRLFAALVAAC